MPVNKLLKGIILTQGQAVAVLCSMFLKQSSGKVRIFIPQIRICYVHFLGFTKKKRLYKALKYSNIKHSIQGTAKYLLNFS